MATLKLAIDSRDALVGAGQFGDAAKAVKSAGKDAEAAALSLTATIRNIGSGSAASVGSLRILSEGLDDLQSNLKTFKDSADSRTFDKFRTSLSVARNEVEALLAEFERNEFDRFEAASKAVTLTSFKNSIDEALTKLDALRNAGRTYENEFASREFGAGINSGRVGLSPGRGNDFGAGTGFDPNFKQAAAEAEAATLKLADAQKQVALQSIAASNAEHQFSLALRETQEIENSLASDKAAESRKQIALQSIFAANSEGQFKASLQASLEQEAKLVASKSAETRKQIALNSIFAANSETQFKASLVDSYSQEVSNSTVLGRLANDYKTYKQAQDQAGDSTQKLGFLASVTRSQISQLFLGFSAAFAIRNAISGAIDTLEEFALQQGRLKGVLSATEEQMQQLSQAAIDIGSNSIYGATKATEALVILAKQGNDTATSIRLLPEVLQFATANQLELADAAGIVTGVMKQFGLSSYEAKKAIDILTVAGQNTRGGVQVVAESLRTTGAVAKGFGNDLASATAILDVLSQRGIPAIHTAAALRTVFFDLVNPTKAAREIIENLTDSLTGQKLTVDQLNPSVVGIIDILKKLKDANLSAADAGILFNRRFAATGLEAIRNADAIKELADKTRDGTDAAQKAADAYENNLGGAFKRFKSTIEGVIVSTEASKNSIGGALEGTVNFASAVIESFGSASREGQKFETSAKVVANALKIVGVAASAIITLQVAGALIEWTTAANGLRYALFSLWVTIEANPISAIVAVAAAAASAIYLFSDSAEDATKKASKLSPAVQDLMDQFDSLTSLGKEFKNIKAFDFLEQAGNIGQQITSIDSLIRSISKAQVEFQRLANTPGSDLSKYTLPSGGAGISIPVGDIQRATTLAKDFQKTLSGLQQSGFVSSEAIEQLQQAREELKKLQESAKIEAAKRGGQDDQSEVYKSLKTDLDHYLDSLKIKIAVQGLDAEAAELETFRLKALSKAREDEKAGLDELFDSYGQEIHLAQDRVKALSDEKKLRETQTQGVKDFQRAYQDLLNKLKEKDPTVSPRDNFIQKQVDVLKDYAKKAGPIQLDLFLNTEGAEEGIDKVRELAGSLYDEQEALKNVKKEQTEDNRLLREFTTLIQSGDRALQNYYKSIDGTVQRYQAQAAAIKETNESRKASDILTQFDIKYLKYGGDILTYLIKRRELVEALQTIETEGATKASTDAEKYVAKIEAQAAALNETSEETRRQTTERELANFAINHTITNMDALIIRLQKANDIIAQGPPQKQQKQAEDIVKNLKAQLDTLYLLDDEKEKSLLLDKLDILNDEKKIANYAKIRQSIIALTDAITQQKKIQELSKQVASSFGDAFDSIVLGTQSVQDAFKSLFQNIEKYLLDFIVTKPLENYLQNLFGGASGIFTGLFGGSGGGGGGNSGIHDFAKGAAFGYGGEMPTRFAYGDTFQQPTRFAYGDSKIGILGEAGPETILPLHHGPGGSLGVKAEGLQTQPAMHQEIHYHTWNISTPDANSFRKNKRQIAQDMKKI